MNDSFKGPPTEEQKQRLEKAMEIAAVELKKYDAAVPVTIIYHNDADGLGSAAIMSEALQRMNRQTVHHCFEQIYPLPLKKIYADAAGPIIFMDLGVGQTCRKFIQENTRQRPTIILDHHDSDSIFIPPGKDNTYDLNCTKYGINGDMYSSASTLVYMFANNLAFVKDLSHLSVLGAFGDKNHTRGEEKGYFPKDGFDSEIFIISENAVIEDDVYKIRLRKDGKDKFVRMERVVEDIALLGSVGYRKNSSEFGIEPAGVTGPELGLQLLLKGYSREIKEARKFLEKIKRDSEESLINYLREGGCEESDSIVYFDTQDFFRGMGVKTVGNFCRKLADDIFKSNYTFIKANKYVMGAQLIEPTPFESRTINPFDKEGVLKISVRVPRELEKIIDTHPSMEVADMLSKVNPTQVGSSHKLRGATIVPKDRIKEFLNCCELYLSGTEAHLDLPELQI